MKRSIFRHHMRDILEKLYPQKAVDPILDRVVRTVETYQHHEIILEKRKKYGDRIVLNEDDAILITYADTVRAKGKNPSGPYTGF